MSSICPETAHVGPPEIPEYDHDLFSEEARSAEEDIAAAALYSNGSVEFAVTQSRPLLTAYALHAYGNPSEVTEPIRYHEAMRTSEETLRRSITRGIGYLLIPPLLEQTLHIVDHGTAPSDIEDQTFAPDMARGRIHQGLRGRLVTSADKKLRLINDTTLDNIGPERLRQDIEPTFVDTTTRVRFHSEKILDVKFGDSWRELDQTLVASMQIKELAGKRLSKHDQRLLLGPSKLLDIYQAVGNAVVAAAEFTAISLEHMQKALAKDAVPAEDFYPYAFANLGKLAFAAQLPFWPAQDIGLRANDPEAPLIFAVNRLESSGLREVVFADPSLQKYYEKGLVAGCQGALQPQRAYMRQRSSQAMSRFVSRLETLSRVGQTQLPHDWTRNTSFKAVTSAEAATALALSIAYSGQYNFVDATNR